MSSELELIAEHALRYVLYDEGRCVCGYWIDVSDNPSQDRIRRLHAAHVVSMLSEHGYSIVPSEGIVRTYQAASTLGHRYMLPKGFGCDREEAERWFTLQQSALEGLPGVDTVRLEYRDEYVTGWLPLAAAAAAEEDQ